MKPDMLKRARWVVLGLLLGAVGLALWIAAKPSLEVFQGQVEVRKVNVAAKIPGRLESVLVREGDEVTAGQVVAVLLSPELEAKAEQAEASVDAAASQNAKAQHGARQQEIVAAQANWERAVVAHALMETTFKRIENLHTDGVVSLQKKDEAAMQLRSAGLAVGAARAQYDMVREGARVEDRATAGAMVRQAKGGRAEVEAYRKETRMTAPISGEISQRTAEPGEIVSAGLPILTILDLSDAWVTFNLREDRLNGLALNEGLEVRVPALDNRTVPLKVTYIAPAGDYATWRSTGESGGFDLRTFEVRAKPAHPEKGLRPGMTVLLSRTRSKAPSRAK